MTSLRSRHPPLAIASLLAALACAPAVPAARDDHDAARAAAATKSADSLDLLRERLAEKLGAVAPGDGSDVVRVVAKSRAVARATPSAPLVRPRAAATASAAVEARDPDWSYSGAGGPENWAGLKPEFAACARGARQSPIDIRDGIAVDLDPIRFDYRPSSFAVIDNGHAVQVDLGMGSSIEVMGRRYDLVRLDFHHPSEERIDGRRFDMEVHLVHRDADGHLAVVAVLLDRGDAQPLVQSVLNNLPLEKGAALAAAAPLDPAELLPKDRRYYVYMGSLTTPPCSEGVLWMVMQQPVPVSPQQIGVFARLYPMNARPIQQAAGRLIKQSN